MFGRRSAALVNRTRRIGPNSFGTFLEVDGDSGGSASCDTQPICRTLFTINTALLSPLFYQVVPQPSSAETSTPRRTCNPILTFKLTFGRMPTVTRLFSANTFREVFALLSVGLPRLASASVASFPRRTCASWCWWLKWWRGFQCRFCTNVTLVPETALVSP